MSGKKQTPTVPKRRRLPAVDARPESRSVSVTKKDNLSGEQEDLKDINETFPSESIVNPAHVSVSGSMTMKLADYQSAKVSVMITRPCHDTPQQIDRVYGECSDWVEKKILAEMERI